VCYEEVVGREMREKDEREMRNERETGERDGRER
jgi:hypothetical protein